MSCDLDVDWSVERMGVALGNWSHLSWRLENLMAPRGRAYKYNDQRLRSKKMRSCDSVRRDQFSTWKV